MIEEIREKIVGGAEFGDLAQMYSEDSTQDARGDWGWIDRRTLNDEPRRKAAFALKPGEVSQVIELGGSYYLLFAEAKEAGETKPLKRRAGRNREGTAPATAPERRWPNGRQSCGKRHSSRCSKSGEFGRVTLHRHHPRRSRGHRTGDHGGRAGVGRNLTRGFTYRVIGERRNAVAGEPYAETARAAPAALEESVGLLRDGGIAAVVTGPIHKARMQADGFEFPGQTEFFARPRGRGEFRDVPDRRRAHRRARHRAHSAREVVAASFSTSEIVRVGELLDDFLATRLDRAPRIAVAGLNPHAGESGALGREEITVIAPALAISRLPASSPARFSPDTVFHRAARGEFDGVLCMYHDQGLIPLKLHAFD